MVDEKKLNIYQKLVEIRKSIGKISKDTEAYGYKYVSGSQVLSAIKPKMDELGVLLESHLLYPTVIQNNYTGLDKYKKEKLVRNFIVSSQMKMIWVNADDPKDRIEVDWYMSGEQKDPSQAFGSGLTYSERYFVMKYFNVPTDDDDPDKPKGNGNDEPPKTTPKTPQTTSKASKLVTEPQLKRYYAMVKQAGLDMDKLDAGVKKQYSVESKNDLTMTQIDKIFDYLEKKIKEKDEQDVTDDFNDKFPEGA